MGLFQRRTKTPTAVVGLITSDVEAVRFAIADLVEQNIDFRLIGCQRFEEFGRPFQHLDLGNIAMGILDQNAVDILLDHGISDIANAGTLHATVHTADTCRVQKEKHVPPPLQDRSRVVTFADALESSGFKLRWLADLAPNMAAGGVGLLNEVALPCKPSQLRGAVGRARRAAARRRCCGAWFDHGDGSRDNIFLYFAEEQLVKFADNPIRPKQPRMLVKVAAHSAHCPLDPPYLRAATVERAANAGVSVIAIDGRRAVIVDRPETLGLARKLGVCVVGI